MLALTLAVSTMFVEALDFPHTDVNNIGCLNCHDLHTFQPGTPLLKIVNAIDPGNIDDTAFNNLCWSCHNDAVAPYRRPHSSYVIDNSYGDWAIECKTCHNPHYNPQLKQYGDESYLYTGYITAVSPSTLTSAGAGWTVDQYAGRVVYPDVSQIPLGGNTPSYRIVSNSTNTLSLTIEDGFALTDVDMEVDVGDQFAILYGKLIREYIYTPNSGRKPVKFFRDTGTNSFADSDTIYNGVCQVCHTKPGHMRNDGSAPDQTHENIGGGTGRKCTEQCHLHIGGFGHGIGGDGQSCVKCHGHEKGTVYDPDRTRPYDPGDDNPDSLVSQGRGTSTPHSTHTESQDGIMPASAKADDHRGPGIYCADCHDIDNIPNFKSGVDLNGDGKYSLAETDVCDDCHSPNGDYNGVNSQLGSVGAKDNWHTGGVYNADGTLKTGKEKWCAGCHDKAPSVMAHKGGVTAPNVIGDEAEDYKYGTGWGFYKTGHGLPSDTFIPSGGNAKPGPGRNCPDCHNTTLPHIDGNHRTFDCGETGRDCDPTEYQEGYRLKRINGADPMHIPFPQNTSPLIGVNYFRLCFSCHTTYQERWVGPKADEYYENDPTNDFWKTNMITQYPRGDLTEGPFNAHYFHMSMNVERYPPDYDYTDRDPVEAGVQYNKTSRPTCVICHNVHGSDNLAMIRNGKLIDREPGIQIWYYNEDLITTPGPGGPPTPEDVPLTSSTGTYWQSDYDALLCADCHGGWRTESPRTSFLDLTTQPPILTWTGENMYTNDGVDPDAGPAGGSFEFRVEYTDTNNSAPTFIQLWIDRNDDGDYADAVEAITLTAVSDADENYYDGKIYSTTITDLSKVGDNILNYRFYAQDPDGNDSIGEATGDSSLYLINGIPTLAWTGETNYVSDGVNPDYSADGASFEFRVTYADSDNECPPAASDIQVWIDTNDDGDYDDGGEKQNMTAGAGTCDSGKLYTYTTNLSHAGDGDLNYRFYASDGTDTATGDPISNSVVSVSPLANYPPILAHEAGACRSDGVAPALGPIGGDFAFTVNYTDGNNVAPTTIQVWIDKNDDGDYLDAAEKLDLTGVDGGDTNYADGKLYALTVTSMPYAGDGNLNYRFYAADATEDAVGIPTQDKTLTVVNGALKVRPTGGAGWYSTIQDAVNASGDPSTILVYPNLPVYPNSEFTAATYNEQVNIEVKHNRTLQSVCGADLTTIASTNNYAVYFRDLINGTVDGFTLTSASSYGLYSLRGDNVELKNSKVTANNIGVSTNDAENLMVSDTEIFSNTIRGFLGQNSTCSGTFRNVEVHSHNAGANEGAGLRFNGGVFVVENSFIHDNTTTSSGGGIYYNGTVAGNAISNTIIAGNQANKGGAVYHHAGGSPTYLNVTIADNTATTSGGALGACGVLTSEIRNSIFWNNVATTEAHSLYMECTAEGASFGTISNSNISTTIDYVNLNANGTTFTDNITPAVDPFFIDAANDDYHISANSPMVDAASAGYAPADDYDGDTRPQGAADDIGADEVATDSGPANDPPVLSWTGETGYVGDGVNPDAAVSESTFEFRVDYTDSNDNPPQAVQLWIDLDNNGAYGDGERFDMDEDNAGDSTYSDGKRYYKQLVLTYVGGGDLNYLFYANDGANPAVGTPTQTSIVSVLNNVPTIAYTGEPNYNVDAVHPDSGVGGDNFVFRVDYTDVDNSGANPIEVWIDLDDSDSYDAGENYAMSVVGGSSAAPYDGDFTNGERYEVTIQVPYVGDGTISYRISASDGVDDATGTPNSDKELTVSRPANDQATLAWYTLDSCRQDGHQPSVTASGVDANFRAIYTDVNDQAPGTIQVWVDENDDSSYGSSEKYNMAVIGGTVTALNDGDYTNGELYEVDLPLALAGDGVLDYLIYATDGVEEAIGAPAEGTTITVAGGLKVRPEGGTGWETSIQSAVTSSAEYDAILVYPNADFTAATYAENVTFAIGTNNRTIQSACGPDLTIVSSSSTFNTFTINQSDNVVIDGFSITGATDSGDAGIYLDRDNGAGTDFIFRNNKIYGNSRGIFLNDSNGTPVKIQNSEIYNNADRGLYSQTDVVLEITDSEFHSHNTTAVGAAMYLNSVTSTTIKRSVFRDNITTGEAGVIYSQAANITIENSIFADNQGSNGGVIRTNSGPTVNITNSTFADNTATAYGGAIFICATGSTTVRNSIFWNNSATTSGHTAYKGCSGFFNNFMTITDSDVDTSAGYFGNGTPNASNNMDPAQNPLFVDAAGDDYHLQSGSPVIDQANATYAPADDIDGDSRPKGTADDMGADEFLTPNNVPTLTWEGVAPYDTDGVDPNSAHNGSGFTFRVKYTDDDNTPPTVIQVWVDMDDDTFYEETEKFDLTAVDGDSDYTDGKLYHTASPIQLWYKGDGVLDYRFYAMDDADEAIGTAVTGATVTVTNTDPTLAWTGEANYTTDGIHPDTDSNKSIFVFRVDYSDTDNDPPAAIQVWIDLDDNTVYDDGEKYDMTAVDIGDSDYTDGRRYVKSMMIPYAGDGTVKYRFYATDGGQDATGAPTVDANLTITNVAPTLEWTGETNYTTDGANPDNGPGGTNFEFRVTFIDDDNNEPTRIQVWVDLDDNGGFTDDEKFAMSEDDYRDSDHTTTVVSPTNFRGKRYTKTLAIGHAGDGELNYVFYATDGAEDATGDPTTGGQTITLTDGPPTLSWTGDANYTTDGINPDGGPSGISFEFRITYADPENSPPAPVQVWVDLDDDYDSLGYYEENEKFTMVQVDPIDSNYVDGKDYSKSLTLVATGDSILKFRFYAYDGLADATGDPTANSTVALINTIPNLDWTGETNYTADGANPDTAVGGSSFEFRIEYTDDDNIAPSWVKVWVDVNNNGSYEEGEKYDMTETTPADTTYSDGKFYTKSLNISKIGDGIVDYKFDAHDGTDPATGTPTSNKTITITNNGPTLAWLGSGNYVADGVDPDSGTSGSGFIFKVLYTDNDNEAPTSLDLYIDKNNDGDYLDAVEVISLTVDTGQDGDYTNGEQYTSGSIVLTKAGDGLHNYEFAASDGHTAATGDPTSTSTVAVVINTTAAGTATAVKSGDYNIDVSMPYGDDDNGDNDYTVEYCVTSSCSYSAWVTNATHAASPYDTTIIGLTAGETYNVRVTYNDTDGVTGTAQQVISSITLDHNSTTIDTASAVGADDYSIDVDMAYLGDNDGENTYTVAYCVTSSCSYSDWVTDATHTASPYSTTITGLAAGETYNVKMTYNDSTGVNGTNPVIVTDITLSHLSTTAGTGTAVAASTSSINVSMPSTGDSNDNNTYAVRYCLTSDPDPCTYTDWVVGATYTGSPYSTTITGLTDSEVYDVQLTYSDTDGVNGTNPQVITGIDLADYRTLVGTATAVPASDTSINVSMPYTADGNGNNNYRVEYCLNSSCSWVDWVNPGTHTVSPYTTTITGLTIGEVYDVRMTYNDTDGVVGTNPQTVTGVDLPFNSTTAGTATAVMASVNSIDVSMPSTGDEDDDNTYRVEYCDTDPSCTYGDWVLGATYTGSPYTTTINGLIENHTYNVRVTYSDGDGVNGTATQVISGILLTSNFAPDTPTNSTPAPGATGVSTIPTLTASAFSDPDVGDIHAESRWQISTDTGANFVANIVYDSNAVADLVSHTIGSTLSASTLYYWRVAYKDDKDGWSDYSSDTSFTTGGPSFTVTKVADTDDGDCSVSDCSLREAIEAANANADVNTIIIPADASDYQITLTGSDDTNALGDYDITNPVNIDGAGSGSTIIVAAASDRVLDILNSSAVTIEGVTIKNGAPSDHGGCIASVGNVTIKNSIIDNCDANGTKNGGGVYTTGAVTVDNSTFSNNHATGSGGAILSVGVTVINGATFQTNTAAGAGGAIYNQTNQVTINGTTLFDDNDSGSPASMGTNDHGGAIWSSGNIVLNDVSGTTTFENSNGYNGGAIWLNTGKSLTATNPTFIGNQSTNAGGAILAYGITITGGATFTNNKAPGAGGAIYNATNPISMNGDLQFNGNEAGFGSMGTNDHGGAIRTNTTITLNDVDGSSTFQNNAGYNGGALYLDGYLLTATDVTFTNNSANNVGGAIMADGITITGGATFVDNSSLGAGGAIFNDTVDISINGPILFENNDTAKGSNDHGGAIQTNTNVTLNDVSGTSVFRGNDAMDGGAIHINSTTKMLTMTGPVFENNAAQNVGGAISVGGITISGGATFWNNSAVSNGGGIYNDAQNIDITGGATFAGHTTGNRGGAIFNSTGTITINGDVLFDNNDNIYKAASSNDEGGAIYSSGPLVLNDVSGSAVFRNNDSYNGGAVMMVAAGDTFSAANVTFENNTAVNVAGAIRSYGITITDGATFKDNGAGNDGGAIYNSGAAIIMDGDLLFDNNDVGTGDPRVPAADDQGGGIFSAHNVTLNNTSGSGVFKNNGADDGGAIFISSNSYSFIGKNHIYTNNYAADVGGAMRIYGGTISDVTFNLNQAGRGGGIFTGNNLLTINGTSNTFTDNDATSLSGGAINASAALVISNATFTSNSANDDGGAIENTSTTDLTDTWFEGNTTLDLGGAIRSTGNMTVTRTTFTNNEATNASGRGGAVFNNGLFTGDRVTIDNNTAGSDGGGLWAGQAKLVNSTISSNTTTSAGKVGGGVYLNNTSGTCITKNATFYGNSAPGNADSLRATFACTITNTIFDNSTTTADGNNNNCNTDGHNVTYTVENFHTCETTGTGYSFDTDPVLVPTLSFNGGTTKTHALQSMSPAIDAGINATCTDADVGSIDQRGETRPTNGGSSLDCDIGAYEYVPVAGAVTVCSSGCTYSDLTTGIASAIGDAAPSGTVNVTDSRTYTSNINFGGNDITVMTNTSASLVGGADAAVVTFSGGETSAAVLDGFIIDNAAATTGNTRGIAITNSSAPTIKNVTLVGNKTTNTWVTGAAIYINGGAATIQDSTIGGDSTNTNECDSGCGIYATSLSGPLSISNSTISHNIAGGVGNSGEGGGVYISNNGSNATTISNSTISNNEASDYGGAIYVNGSLLTLEDSTVDNNQNLDSGLRGGAIAIYGAASSVAITDTDFSGNTSTGRGAAIHIEGSTAATPLSITGGTFTNNTSSLEGAALSLNSVTNASVLSGVTITGNNGQKGAGIYSNAAPINITNSTLDSNTAVNDGGAMRINGAASVVTVTGGSISENNASATGGGVLVEGGATFNATGTTINSNALTPSVNLGGGLYVTGAGSSATLTKVKLQGNKVVQRGGGIYMAGSTTVNLINSLITGNTAGTTNWEEGGGIYTAGTLNVFSSTISGNHAASKGGGIFTTGATTIKNSVIWGNATDNITPQINGTVTATYSDIDKTGYESPNAENNIRSDPKIINLGAATLAAPTTIGDYHIIITSPTIDQGVNDGDMPSDDIDGDSRPLGGGPDMGADERN